YKSMKMMMFRLILVQTLHFLHLLCLVLGHQCNLKEGTKLMKNEQIITFHHHDQMLNNDQSIQASRAFVHEPNTDELQVQFSAFGRKFWLQLERLAYPMELLVTGTKTKIIRRNPVYEGAVLNMPGSTA